MLDPLPIAVFLSGSGRTLQNLILHRDEAGLPIDIRLVISSREHVRGVEIARQAGLPTLVIPKSKDVDPENYSQSMFEPCRQAGAAWVVMAGFLKHVLIPPDFENRVINIHPSLLPQFGGPGMYGQHVHEAVIRSRATESGCTVHFVDNQYDHYRWYNKICRFVVYHSRRVNFRCETVNYRIWLSEFPEINWVKISRFLFNFAEMDRNKSFGIASGFLNIDLCNCLIS